MEEPTWVTRRIVDVLHQEQIGEHGGSFGVRDDGLIESALSRPQQKWMYDPETDVFGLAAAYAYGLAKNHGYLDGNKRVAFVTMYVFLGLNGFDLDAAEPEVVGVMTDLASGVLAEEEFAAWLRTHSVPLDERT